MSASKPAVPTPVTILLVLVAVALIAGAYLVGRWLGAPEEPEEPVDDTPPALVAPPQLGAFQLGEHTSPSPAAGVDKEIVRANYTDGTDRVLLVLARPESNVEAFLTDAGIEDLQAQEDVEASGEMSAMLCGVSADTDAPACGRINDGVGELIVGVTEVPVATVKGLLDDLQR